MRWFRRVIPGFSLPLSIAVASPLLATAAATPAEPRVGAVTLITRQLATVHSDNRGSTSSTSNSDAFVERVVAVRADGVELEYDLPHDGGFESASGSWQFPTRVFRPLRGALQLVNASELTARVDGWLKSAGLTRAACGHWVSGWTVFRIECDPKSALAAMEPLNLYVADLRDGATYSDPDAAKPTTLKRTKSSAGGATYSAETALDPERLRQQTVQRDLASAEIAGKSLTAKDALRAHASDKISGTVTVSLDVDGDGTVMRRTRRLRYQVIASDGTAVVSTITEVISRQPASAAAPAGRDQGPMVLHDDGSSRDRAA